MTRFEQGQAVTVISSDDYPGAVGKIGLIVDPNPNSVEWIALEGINSSFMDALTGYPSFRAAELRPV
ncbi:hypothetical protein ACH4OW_28280 [Streptomyces sp. NPDC017056]|uniref:hypothetical protein n=1 Tax=Streptomyces sp. NPDC017056 TaxID=3364973 RepID=UPI0037977B0E